MTRSGRICWGLSLLGPMPVLYASRPLDPLPTPCYSFDLASPQITPTGPLDADDVLTLDPITQLPPPPRSPRVKFDGALLGMGQPGDELDGLSSQNPDVPMAAAFALLISVDRASMGAVPSDPALVAAGIPYNVSHQAARGHAAGDLFMSTRLFNRLGMIPSAERLLGGNTALVINNYDEGGTDFEAEPPTSANGNSPGPQDNVDATAYIDSNGVRGLPLPTLVFFSADRDSPSLGPGGKLPGNSGADIFVAMIFDTQSFVVPYALAGALGLQPGDDVDGMLVFDTPGPPGEVPRFEAGDQVLASLTADSPSLTAVGGSPADIISITARPPPIPPLVAFFARATDFGLEGGTRGPDNIDAIEFFYCADALACARLHGIRRVGDFNHNNKVDLFDAHFFWSCFSGSDVPAAAGCHQPFDADQDLDIDLVDWGYFRHDMTGPL